MVLKSCSSDPVGACLTGYKTSQVLFCPTTALPLLHRRPLQGPTQLVHQQLLWLLMVQTLWTSYRMWRSASDTSGRGWLPRSESWRHSHCGCCQRRITRVDQEDNQCTSFSKECFCFDLEEQENYFLKLWMTEWPVAEQTKINKPEQKKSCSKDVQHCNAFLHCHAQKINENGMDKRLDGLIFFSQSWHCDMGRRMGVAGGDDCKRGSSNMLQGTAFEIFQRECQKAFFLLNSAKIFTLLMLL